MDVQIRHEPENRRFAAVVDGETAYLAYAPAGEKTLEYVTTFVPDGLRGRGLATALARHALDYAREHGLQVIPTCSFVASTIRRSPEYSGLVAPERLVDNSVEKR